MRKSSHQTRIATGIDQVDENVKTEERGVKLGQVGQARQREFCGRAVDLCADIRLADQGAQAKTEEHQRQAAGKLICLAMDDQITKDHVHQTAHEHGNQHAEKGIAGQDGHRKAGGGADQQDTLQTEVDDAGTLVDHFAQGGVKKRDARKDGAGKNAEDG